MNKQRAKDWLLFNAAVDYSILTGKTAPSEDRY
jgi:hypothetical protein